MSSTSIASWLTLTSSCFIKTHCCQQKMQYVFHLSFQWGWCHIIKMLHECLKCHHHMSSFSSIHKMRYQECGKWDDFCHSYFILLSLKRKDLAAIIDIHDISYLWMGPVPCFFKIVLFQLDNVRKFIVIHVIIYKCNDVLSILVGLTKWDNKLSNPLNDHYFVTWSHHCKEWE